MSPGVVLRLATLVARRRRVGQRLAGLALAFVAPLANADTGAADELLFMSNRANNVFEYYRMNPQTRTVQRVLTERGEVGQMSWSPDGTRVLFLAARNGPFQNIFVTDLRSGATSQLTREELPVSEPSWSPDGTSIAYVTAREGSRRIFMMAADGSNQRRVSSWTAHDEISPRFSPDGRQIAFLAGFDGVALPRVSVVDVATGKARTISGNKARGTETPPIWSPDGRRVLTSATRGQQSQLVAIEVDGSGSTDLTKADGRHSDPHYSPDGKQLIYLAIPTNSARQSLYVMNADGSNPRKLHGADHDIMGARWSADGQRVYFVEHLDIGGKIFAIDASGQNLQRLSGDEGFDVDVQPCCRPRPRQLAALN